MNEISMIDVDDDGFGGSIAEQPLHSRSDSALELTPAVGLIAMA